MPHGGGPPPPPHKGTAIWRGAFVAEKCNFVDRLSWKSGANGVFVGRIEVKNGARGQTDVETETGMKQKLESERAA